MPSSSPAPDGQHSGEDTGTGRCVYLPETKCCAVADGNALEQVVHSDTTVTLQRSLRCRESSFSLNITHRGLFVDLELDDTNLAIRFFFPCGLSYLFYSNLWIARISSPYLFKLRVGFLEAINYVVDKNLKVKLATSSC